MGLPIRERVVLVLGLVGLGLVAVYTGALQGWDRLLYDVHQRHWSRPASDRVLIVAIDDRSIEEIGRWPWPRSIHARLIERLTEADAAAIGLNIIFSEPAVSAPEDDARLAAAIEENGRIVLPVVPAQDSLTGQMQTLLPLPALARRAAGLGHTDLELDRDGVLRRVWLRAGLGEPHWLQFGLQTLGLADPRALARMSPQLAAMAGRWPALSGLQSVGPLDADSERIGAPPGEDSGPAGWVRDQGMLIAFAGPAGSFRRISYVDVLRGGISAQALRDRIVLVGPTATGLGSRFATPVSAQGGTMPGTEIHANIIDALLQGVAVHPLLPPWQWTLTAVLVLLGVWINDRVSPRAAIVGTLGALFITLLSSVLLLRLAHLWFAPAVAAVGQLLCYPLWSWRRLEQTRDALAEQQRRLQVMVQSIGDGVVTTDRRGRIQYMNPAAESLCGTPLSQARSRSVAQVVRLVNEATAGEIGHPIEDCLAEGRVLRYPEHSTLIGGDGARHAVHALAAPIRSGVRGGGLGVVITLADVTESRELVRQMAHQATHDALTHLPNRTLLLDRLAHAISRARRGGRRMAVMFLDLDRFKTVNDALGHAAGDLLLCRVADRLRHCCRGEDTIARLGGDEFVFVLENLDHEEQAALISQKILEALQAPFRAEEHEFVVTGSLGISLFPKDGDDPATLLKLADAAMYEAKAAGRNGFRLCAGDLDRRALDQLVMAQQLRQAISDEQLVVYYQPVIALPGEALVAVEALVRWQHPVLGLLGPARFIPLAEETGLVSALGLWVLRESCRQLKSWRDRGMGRLHLAINLSCRQFQEDGLVASVRQVLTELEVDGRYLDLEITESLIMRDVDSSTVTLRALKDLGVQLSIDDFGTGYSSLSYLKRLPIDTLKIDQSFVCDIDSDSESEAIVRAVIAMAHSLGLKVIAEGVENPAQLALLKTLDCDAVQGYLLGPPLSAAELMARWGTSEPPAGLQLAAGDRRRAE